MAIDPEQLINAAISRADATQAAAQAAINDIGTNRTTYFGAPTVDIFPYLRGFPDYKKPNAENSPSPIYESPEAPLPDAPTFEAVDKIAKPQFPTKPSKVVISDLFNQQAPSMTIPDWNETEPDLMVDSLVDEMNDLVKPVLKEFDFPVLSALSLRDAPTITVPAYDAPVAPTALTDPSAYNTDFQDTYNQMTPDMQAFINDTVNSRLSAYCPGFATTRSLLETKLQDGMNSTVLPDQIESAMFTRARGRVEKEYAALEANIYAEGEKRGFFNAPGEIKGRAFQARLDSAGALSNQANEVYIDRKKMEVQHLQFVMGLSSSYVSTIFNLTVQYADAAGKTMQMATAFSSEKTDKLMKVYEHMIEKAKLAIAVMDELGKQYDTRLKAALAELEGFKLELEAEKAKKDVEIAQVQAIESQIRAQDNNVKLYSALIDAIARKGALEELKIKGYTVRSDVFKNRVQAQIAGFDVYKAALDGDKSKLEARLTDYKLYETELKAVDMELEANIKSVQSVIESNKAELQVFAAGSEVYKLSAQAALQKFTQLAEVKKLAQAIYKTELEGGINIFEAESKQVASIIEAVLREYEGRIRSFVSTGGLNMEQVKLQQQASVAVAELSSHVAAAASGAVNSMVSSTTSATN